MSVLQLKACENAVCLGSPSPFRSDIIFLILCGVRSGRWLLGEVSFRRAMGKTLVPCRFVNRFVIR